MNNRIRIVIGYDASECANDAIDGLTRAGLPEDVDALVVSVAEVWVLESPEEGAVGAAGGDATYVQPISEHAKRGLERATTYAERGATRLAGLFPNWNIETRVYPDSPAWGILRAEEEWGPDLIVVGSQGRSALGRLIMGSVSQKVLTESRCSVRIARRPDEVIGSPLRLVVAVDGTPDSNAAVDEIASRSWPEKSAVRVVSAVVPVELPAAPPLLDYDAEQLAENDPSHAWELHETAANQAAEKLRAAGLIVDTCVRTGAPIPTILDNAEEIGADAIFIGARGHHFMERFLLGSVSNAVAARAACSVEVVRRK